jgi:glycosyltransferase involved in cell wall biosynthesis
VVVVKVPSSPGPALLLSFDPLATPHAPRVLFVTGAYSPEFSAGGLQSQAVARVLGDRAAIRVLTTATDPTLKRDDIVDGVPVSRVMVDRAGKGPGIHATLRMLIELMRILPDVDLVHVQGFSTKNILIAAAARMFRRPLVLHLQTARHDEPDTIKAQGRLAWWAFTSADRFLSVSPALAAAARAAAVPAGKIDEVPNAVDTGRFTPASAGERMALRLQLNLPTDRAVVLFVGVISPDKQPHVLLDAWLRTQSDPALASSLVLVGATDPALYELEDRLIDRLRATTNASGFADRVVFVAPTARIEDYFRAADVYALPSLREGLPIALLEAMACGLPCVASHLPGATDAIIEHGTNGRLVPPGDAGALAAALAEVLSDPLEAARMGAAARRTVETRYTIERVAEMWLGAYDHVLANR